MATPTPTATSISMRVPATMMVVRKCPRAGQWCPRKIFFEQQETTRGALTEKTQSK